jgi:hypothetical protein
LALGSNVGIILVKISITIFAKIIVYTNIREILCSRGVFCEITVICSCFAKNLLIEAKAIAATNIVRSFSPKMEICRENRQSQRNFAKMEK